ncbi:hypothetical protein Tco_1057381 [Tanacetum coccineum]|uniref:Uncharacterized protein n=1 Tax=Tanacetum coccineum TaxID=301880 RepID=A0ABQ5H6J9_9ASTR
MAPPAHSPPLPPSSGCLTQIQTLRIASTQALIDAVTAALPPPSLPPLPPSLTHTAPVDREGWSTTRVVELAELHERDTQDLYALLEDAQDGRSRISQRVDMNSQRVNLLMGDRMTLQETVWDWWRGVLCVPARLGLVRYELSQATHQRHSDTIVIMCIVT